MDFVHYASSMVNSRSETERKRKQVSRCANFRANKTRSLPSSLVDGARSITRSSTSNMIEHNK